jgi:hypothetical protein
MANILLSHPVISFVALFAITAWAFIQCYRMKREEETVCLCGAPMKDGVCSVEGCVCSK